MSNTGADESDEGVVETEPHRTTFTDSEEPVSKTVISAVAAATERDPLAMPPLYDAIDPDALDALFRPARNAPRRGDRRLEFTYDGHDVTVKSYGVIAVEPLEEDEIQ